MRLYGFANRCAKEILRDPLTLVFGLGFPIVLLLLLSAIQANVPVSLFEISHLTPGITVFGLSFMTLFSATLVARDRESAFLQRLYTTPMKPSDYILGYMLPMIPIAVLQCLACYLVALVLGMSFCIHILYAVVTTIPVAVFYIALGLLCGSVLNVKQVGGICGALLTNLSAWFSGVWFDLDLVGAGFRKFANFLPFVHAVELERGMISGNFEEALQHVWPVVGYTIVILFGAVWLFLRQMTRQ